MPVEKVLRSANFGSETLTKWSFEDVSGRSWHETLQNSRVSPDVDVPVLEK